jgi:hypothetical protein
MNGVNYASESIHVLHVGKMRIKLCKGKTTLAKEYYSTLMQVIAKFKSFFFPVKKRALEWFCIYLLPLFFTCSSAPAINKLVRY